MHLRLQLLIIMGGFSSPPFFSPPFSAPTTQPIIMSLYTFRHRDHSSDLRKDQTQFCNHPDQMADIKVPAGLEIRESADIELLARLGEVSKEEVMRRLVNDHLAFVAFLNGVPAAFGWMARGKASIGELNHTMILPIGHRYLWNFRTIAEFRGQGIYPALLQYILRYEGTKARQFWIIHAPENQSSLRGIIKAGFHYVGKLYTDHNGEAVLEATDEAHRHRSAIEYMDIRLSDDDAASCWNCTSPYLKKRKAECCCDARGNECSGTIYLPESMAFPVQAL